MSASIGNVLSIERRLSATERGELRRVTFIEATSAGLIKAEVTTGALLEFEWLVSASGHVPLEKGDKLLALVFGDGSTGVVLGKVGRYQSPATARTEEHVVITASSSIALRCGESSVDLRADGKVMIRGDDVLVRAKGTKRIRAGTVSIN